MKRNVTINVVVLIVMLTAMITYYRYDTGKKEKITEQLRAEYPSVTINEKFAGIVSEIYHPYPELFKEHPLQAHVLLNESVKKSIRTGSELHKKITLDSVLSVGDYLVKNAASDTLFIYKAQSNDTVRYSFELRDDLGYPLKKH
jgi:hypothetical protein